MEFLETFIHLPVIFIGVAVLILAYQIHLLNKENAKILHLLITNQEQQCQKFEDLQDDLEKILRDSRPSVGGENNWDNIRNAFGTPRELNERNTIS